jgi:hypothetical protein
MIIALAMFLAPMSAVAAGLTFPQTWQQELAAWAATVITGLDLLTWVVFLFLAILIDPDFIFGTNDSLMLMLNSIWVLTRDLVNIALAVMLIAAAVYTVITANKEFVSSHIKKFILAVILVNFSWFIPRVIMDVGNIAAATVYGVPSLLATQGSSSACSFKTSKQQPGLTCQESPPGTFNCKCGMVANAAFFIDDKDVQRFKDAGWECLLFNILCIRLKELDVNTVAGHSTVLNGLIVNHARLLSLATVPPTGGRTTTSAMLLFIIREIVVIVIHIALLFPLAALAIAFAIRIPVLWFTIAFMPFVVLKYLLPSNLTFEFPDKIWSYFIKAAFLPAIAGIPLTIGFIMVNAGAGVVSSTNLGSVQMKLTDNIGDFWELLWLFMTLGVMWVGVFAVLEKMDKLGLGSQAIKGFGQTLGGIAVKLPLAIPAIPGVGNLLSLPRRAEAFKGALSSGAGGQDTIKKAMDAFRGGGVDKTLLNKSADDHKKDGNFDKLDTHMKDLIAAYKETDKTKREDGIKKATANIKNDYNIEIDPVNPESTLREYLNKLEEKQKKDGISTAPLNSPRTNLADLEKQIRNAPPTTP